MKCLFKGLILGISLVISFPCALSCGFGRWERIYTVWAHWFALFPSPAGDYLRIAFYHQTLEQCPLENRIQFGSFFAHPQARLGKGIYIGAYCILGRAQIGDHTQIASSVQVLSGKKQHERGEAGQIYGAERGHFETISIGADCWIGAGAIVMAEVGQGSTVGAGAVVNQRIEPWSMAVGNPARVIRSTRDVAAP